jgi:asparagine synthase (glutamine-hydrolysing)
MVDEPLRWDRHVRHIARSRAQYFALRNFELKARQEADVSYETPFLDDRFLTEWARFGGMLGFPDRTTAMRRLFRDLLPDGILARETKGTYNFSVFNRHSARFVQEWDGEGVDPEMVDPIALRTEWLSPIPDASTYLLLQQAWLAIQAVQSRP